MSTKREPLLSDADLGFVKDLYTPEQVRDFYENLIDKGELMVVKTTRRSNPNCEHCDAWLAGDGDFVVDHNFCPDCAAKIV